MTSFSASFIGNDSVDFRKHRELWVGKCAKVLEVGALAECWVDDGGVFFGRVEDDAVVMSPMVDVGL